MTAEQYCEDRAAQSGSSFYYSFLFLPPEKRRAITALYALCREVDDVADECREPAVARAKLSWWRIEIAAAYNGAPQHPVSRALAPVVREFRLPQEMLQEVIDGMEMDLVQNRYADFASLQPYCHRVAGVVGQLSAEIFGFQDRATLAYAHDLGIAFQLTNIIRDVGEDARRNRIYLPLDEMEQHGVAVADVLNARETDNFARLMEFQAGRARDWYRKAFSQLPAADRRAQRAGIIMAAIYQTLLAEIVSDGCRVLSRRVSLTPLRKFWIAFKTWARD